LRQKKWDGRPTPCDLLKLYIYGYLYRIRASRRLEAETHRNVQVMWLIKALTPGSRPLRIFRKDHARATWGVCVLYRFCREQSLFGAELLAIDGTKIAAVASRKRVITPAEIAKMNAATTARSPSIWLRWTRLIGRSRKRPVRKPDVAAAIAALKAQKAGCRAGGGIGGGAAQATG